MQKITAFLSVLLLISLLSSCGKYNELQSELDLISIEATLPDAAGGAVTLEEAAPQIYDQQIALCNIYNEAYQKTDSGAFVDRYTNLNKNKLLSELNSARQDIIEDYAEIFAENMVTILADVTDCTNVSAYVQKRYSEVQSFYLDYGRFMSAGNDASVLCDLLIKYSESTNEIAKEMLKQNQEKFTEAAVVQIETNAAAKSDFRAKITNNNSIIDAINLVYGGVYDEYVKRINNASLELVTKLIESMESLTEKEKNTLIKQYKNGEEMTIELEDIPDSRSTSASSGRK